MPTTTTEFGTSYGSYNTGVAVYSQQQQQVIVGSQQQQDQTIHYGGNPPQNDGASLLDFSVPSEILDGLSFTNLEPVADGFHHQPVFQRQPEEIPPELLTSPLMNTSGDRMLTPEEVAKELLSIRKYS